MGNLRSVAKALERVGATVDVTPTVPRDADGLVVPGQGAFGSCLVNLGPAGRDAIAAWIAEGRPYLGICLGFQVLFEQSQEGGGPGLGVFEGKVVRFPDGAKIPHIGWNEVRPTRAAPLFDGIAGQPVGTTTVDAITLFQSKLSPKGATYTAMQKTPLRR